MAKKAGAKVIAFCGQAGKDACVVNDNNIDAFFPVLRSVCTAEEAMNAENARQNLCI
jgi:glycerate kinase